MPKRTDISSILIIGVQYHPDARPGPQDSFYLFEKFVGMMENDGDK